MWAGLVLATSDAASIAYLSGSTTGGIFLCGEFQWPEKPEKHFPWRHVPVGEGVSKGLQLAICL